MHIYCTDVLQAAQRSSSPCFSFVRPWVNLMCIYCPFFVQIIIVNLHNTAPQAGAGIKARMNTHLQQTQML